MARPNTRYKKKTVPKGDESEVDGSFFPFFFLVSRFRSVKAGQRLMKAKVHKLCGELS